MTNWSGVVPAVLLIALSVGCQTDTIENLPSAGSTEFDAADRLAVQNLIANAFINLDSFNIDDWITSYTEDATFIVIDAEKPPFQLTRDQLHASATERFRQFKEAGKQRRHVMTNFAFVSQTRDSAHLKCNGVLFSTENHEETKLITTLYGEGWFVKRDGTWLIQKWIIGNDAPINTGDTKQEVESYGITPAEISR